MIKNLKIEECIELLGQNYIGRLAFVSYGEPSIVPITYFHDAEEKCILSYSSKGHKIVAMQNYGLVALQVDEISSIQNWKSVQVHGEFEELQGSTAKKYLRRFAEGVQNAIAKKKDVTPKFIQDFSSRLGRKGIPIVYKISINDITGKFRHD